MKSEKSRSIRWLSVLLSIVLVVGAIPVGVWAAAASSAMDSYIIRLSEEVEGVAVTLTEQGEEPETSTVETNSKGEAVFEDFVQVGQTYRIAVAEITGYQTVEEISVTIGEEDQSCDISLTALEKAVISGTVYDENQKPLTGAEVQLSGYITDSAATSEDGSYQFNAYAGKNYTITVSGGEKYEEQSFRITNLSRDLVQNCSLEVKIFQITGTVEGEGGGTVTPQSSTVPYGDSVNITIQADKGYKITSIKDNDNPVDFPEDSTSYTYSLEEVCDNHEITATFEKAYYVRFTVEGNGQVSYEDGDGTETVSGGSVDVLLDPAGTLRFYAVPNTGYRVTSVVVGEDEQIEDDHEVENNFQYEGQITLNNAPVDVSVEFSPNIYTVTASAVENGTVTPPEDKAEYNSTAKVSITPHSGYDLDQVTVNGIPLTDLPEGTLTETNEGYCASFKIADESGKEPLSDGDTFVITASFDEQDKKEVSHSLSEHCIETDYYTITFSPLVAAGENGTYRVPGNGSVTIKPKTPYQRIRVNGWAYRGESVTLDQATEISEISLSETEVGGWKTVVFPTDITVIWDKAAPTVTDITKCPNTDWANEPITVTVTAQDDGAGVDWVQYRKETEEKWNNAVFCEENQNWTFTLGNEGESGNYLVRVTDRVGNVSEEQPVSVQIDKTAPRDIHFTIKKKDRSADPINFLKYGTFYHASILLTVTAKDSGSGVKEFALSLGENENPITLSADEKGSACFELSTEQFQDGGKNLSVVVTDRAGNKTDPVEPGAKNSNPIIQSSYVNLSSEKFPTIKMNFEKEDYKDENSTLWYNEKTDFTVQVLDQDGLKSVVVRIDGKTVHSEENLAGGDQACIEWESSLFSVSGEGSHTVTVYAVNVFGNLSTSEQVVNIDQTAPDVTGYRIQPVNDSAIAKLLNFLSFGTFFNQQVEVWVQAEDSGEFPSGVKTIALYASEDVPPKTPNSEDLVEVSEADSKGPDGEETDGEGKWASFVLPAEELQENGVYSKYLYAVATDQVGNTTKPPVSPNEENSDGTIKSSHIMVENIAPTAKITVPEAAATIGEQLWYGNDTSFTVAICDPDSGINSVQICLNGESLEVNRTRELRSDDGKLTEQEFEISTASVPDSEDGAYTLQVRVADNAGNETESEQTVYIDRTAPRITQFDFTPDDYVEGEEKPEGGFPDSVEITDYGFYFKSETEVKIAAQDDAPASGVQSITYWLTDKSGSVVQEEQLLDTAEDGSITVTIRAGFKGQIWAYATDRVGRFEKEVHPDGVIVETPDQHEKEANHVVFDKPKTDKTDNNNVELYGEDVPVTVTINDTISGIRAVEWTITSEGDKEADQSGKIEVENNPVGSTIDGWKIVKQDHNLVTQLQNTITVNSNSNDITFQVKMTDRSGNWTKEEIHFSIDKTVPVIDISYDNNTPDENYSTLYQADRTAKIVITERNFRAEDVWFAITNTDSVIPNVNLSDPSAWTQTAHPENPDQTTYTAYIPYTADGDYTFDLSYTDNAGHSAAPVATQQFTIDKTLPVVSVSYDNMEAQNGNYYMAGRTAVLTVVEHNFDPSRVRILGTAADNGAEIPFPSISGWQSEGDTHVTTIPYTQDANYHFDIEMMDMAGNSIADYTPEEFYVDQTAPTIVIGGVADHSANNGSIAPSITMTDTNYDGNAVQIALTGSRNGTVSYNGAFHDVENGQTYTYSDFLREQSVDDLYTLSVTVRDRAGNETSQTLQFSANRFGSVYTFDPSLEEIVGKYVPAERDVVFTETNVDTLDRESIRVKLTKNGIPSDLKEGTDYTIEQSGGNGSWSQYRYVINRSLFAEDGRYSVAVYSLDAAGNTNENIDEVKKAEISFGVDKTSPVVVPVDFESGVQYPVESKSVDVEVKDNLVLQSVSVYLNNEPVEITENGETYRFTVPQSNSKQNVRIVATDSAGNTQTVEVTDFLVSTNLFVRWYNNTPLFVGSIVMVVAAAAGLVLLVVFRRRKKTEE